VADLIEKLITDWGREGLGIDVRAMGAVGRIMRLGTIYESNATAVLKPYGLRYTEFDVLATLRRSGEPFQLNPKQLIDSVLLTSGAMTACLDRLEERQLINRVRDPSDRRGRLIVLTHKGIKLVEQAVKYRFEQAQNELKCLSGNEQKELTKLLEKLSLAQM
jgi:DNA-binding MarR family transcriptional regulator